MRSSACGLTVKKIDRVLMHHARHVFGLAALSLALALQPARAETIENCYSDWSAAGIIVKAERLMPVEQLAKLAPSKLGVDLVRSVLCETKTGFVYRLVVRDKAGVSKSISVDAKRPFE